MQTDNNPYLIIAKKSAATVSIPNIKRELENCLITNLYLCECLLYAAVAFQPELIKCEENFDCAARWRAHRMWVVVVGEKSGSMPAK